MARAVDNFGTFLNTVNQATASSDSITRSAPSSGAAQQVLQGVLAFPNGVDLGSLYKQTALDFSVFAEAVERLKKLNGIRVEKEASGEIAYPGSNWQDVAALVS